MLDDDVAVLRTVGMMARRLGAEVKTCSTFAEFDAALQSFEPDILLVDLMMPEADGIDVISAIGSRSSATIHVMTGADKRTFEASREVLASSNLAVCGYIQKPFATDTLARVLAGSSGAERQDQSGIWTKPRRDLLGPEEFEKAVRNGQIEPYFQPIFAADGKTLKGFEALARIEDERKAFFAPEYLDQLVNDTNLAAALTDIVINRSLDFMAKLPKSSELTISINIFGIHAVADGFRQRLSRQCARYGIARNRVILELSEATVFNLDEDELRKVTQLRLAGFGLAIDDFGTGHSSLARLATLPFSELKVDKSFCLALPQSDSAAAVIEACLGLAGRLDMKVTAEGIECRKVAALLADMGCHALQGHLFGQAMPAKVALRWVDQRLPRAVA